MRELTEEDKATMTPLGVAMYNKIKDKKDNEDRVVNSDKDRQFNK